VEPSPRVAAALERSHARQTRERRALRALGLPLLLVVVLPSVSSHPDAAVAVALAALIGAFSFIIARAAGLDRGERELAPTVIALLVMTAASVVLITRQPNGTGELGVSLVAWVAGSRLSLRLGIALVAAATAAAVVAVATTNGETTGGVTSSILLASLLFLMARLFRQAQVDRERAELAAAELEDAREREVRSAAVAERSRIARELHDVLAHSLSGLTLQLEGARLTAEQEGSSERLREMLARSHRLAGDGLREARRAVRTLRGEDMPGLGQLSELVEGFRQAGLDVELRIDGERSGVAAEAGLTVYRAVQEALTNVARHSGAGHASVDVRVDGGMVRLVVTDDGAGSGAPSPELAAAGSGYGLSAMRERAELLGGTVQAGPADGGFRVELALPS